MHAAVIDLGTNTFNCIIAEINPQKKKFDVFFSRKIPVKLGEGGIHQKRITKEATERAFKALKEYRHYLEKHQVKAVHAYATSAIRDASNQKEFIEKAEEIIKAKISIIDGNKEAELIWKGVNQALDMGKEKHLIMDIGGGSTEFIIADTEKIYYKESTQLGASRLLEQYHPADPIGLDDIKRLEKHFNKVLHKLFNEVKKHSIPSLLGSSGSFETLAEMASYKEQGKPLESNKTAFDLSLNTFLSLHKELLQSDYEKRINMPGMVKMRADMIVVGSLLIHFILSKTAIKQIKVAKYALKEGALQEIIESTKT